MKNLLEYHNTFTKDQYPPNEKNVSDVPYADIQLFLLSTFGGTGYSIKTVWVGTASGRSGAENAVVIELTLPLENGQSITVPGSAQGSIGIPGLIAIAIRNAVLRHLGTGAVLYEHAEGEEPQFDGAPANPFKEAQQHSFGNAQSYGSQGKNYGPWTGEVQIKSPTSKYSGMKWSQVPQDALVQMANNGINFAQKELARRSGS